MRREGASPKDVEKAELKLRKSCDEYNNLLEKYNNIREEFEKCMSVSCKVSSRDTRGERVSRALILRGACLSGVVCPAEGKYPVQNTHPVLYSPY